MSAQINKLRFYSAWIEESQIKNYAEFKDELIKTSKTAAFKEACQKIEEFISDPVVSIIKKLLCVLKKL